MTQPESITLALETIRDNRVGFNSVEWKLAACVLANAYVRELDPTPISAEALVADGWFHSEMPENFFGCEDGVWLRSSVAVQYSRASETWSLSVSFNKPKTMGELRTLLRFHGVSAQ